MDALPKVYAWRNEYFGRNDEVWLAIADDGEVLASHVSSNRAWGQRDVHDSFPKVLDRYIEKFGGSGPEFYEYIVVPDGETPPEEVRLRNEERGKAIAGDS